MGDFFFPNLIPYYGDDNSPIPVQYYHHSMTDKRMKLEFVGFLNGLNLKTFTDYLRNPGSWRTGLELADLLRWPGYHAWLQR
jgi:hypothetical protein